MSEIAQRWKRSGWNWRPSFAVSSFEVAFMLEHGLNANRASAYIDHDAVRDDLMAIEIEVDPL